MTGDVVQKLLVPSMSANISSEGYAVVGGPVARAQDVASFGAAALLRAHGLDGEGSPFGRDPDAVPYVDVLRFATDPLMSLSDPPAGPERPWPTFPTGFLHGAPAPVWLLEETRLTPGAEFWRIGRDGTQSVLSVYDGAALGWRGARGYVPPVQLVGTRARWQGLDLAADLVDQARAVDLVLVGPEAPDGFREARPQVWVSRVPVEQCDAVFALRMTATWRGVAGLVVQSGGGVVSLLLLGDDPEAAARIDATQIEPGRFMVRVPADELEDRVGTTRELSLS